MDGNSDRADLENKVPDPASEGPETVELLTPKRSDAALEDEAGSVSQDDGAAEARSDGLRENNVNPLAPPIDVTAGS